MASQKIINIGIGFVTGRLLFQNVLRTYINNWLEHGLIENKNVRIHVLVSYDLKYKNTNVNDYKGEDTFMSTALTDLKVMKVPCYAFHDGFSMYNNLLNGVLPVELKPIENTKQEILMRFINATIGWVRYKPLLVYRENHETIMQTMEINFEYTIPKLCTFFETQEFNKILIEFQKYRANVREHFQEFEKTKKTWSRLLQNAI